MREIVARRKLENLVEIDSAGTASYHSGEDIDPRMKKALARRGYRQVTLARQVTVQDLDSFDYVFAMDRSNLKNLQKLCSNPQQLAKVELVCSHAKHHSVSEVPDPYYGGSDDFEYVITLLEDACEGVLQKVIAPRMHS